MIMPTLTGPLVVAPIYDGLCTFEFGIVAEVFGLARPEMGENWYRFASAAIEPGPLRAHGGITVMADGGSELIDRADMIVIPGWKGADVPVSQDLCMQLRRAHARGARLASICSGAFVLAASGLLDGRVATTHWRYADLLRTKFPQIKVDAASLYQGNGNIWTSAGSAAGIDLMIELVRQDFGPEAANSVARRIVLPTHRSGGQAQFLERPVPSRPDGDIAGLLNRIRTNLSGRWTIALMADQVRMSRRTFERRFAEATGQTPGDWLIRERIEAAKDLLLRSKVSIEDVAASTGFGSAHALRMHFRERLQATPGHYRRSFASRSGSLGSFVSR
jgi:AraC family transcriptional activator FtrA